jgi:hypothetical protein
MQAISDPNNASVSLRSKLIGDEAVGVFLEILNEFKFEEVEELFADGESGNTQVTDEGSGVVGEESSSGDSSPTDLSEYEPSPKRATRQHIPLDVKIKVFNLAKEHPKWSISTLRNMGSIHLKHKGMLAIWEKDIKAGGTKLDKLEMIDRWVYDRFVEARNRNQPVMTRTLQEWAISASFQHLSPGFEFSASTTWVASFKKRHRIVQRKVTKYVSTSEQASIEEIVQSAIRFQNQTKSLISKYNRDYIINTDQTGCAYRGDIKRTLSQKGEKTVQVTIGSLSRVSHSYTVQYAITASGKLLPKVFLCMQEPGGDFGPRVCETIKKLEKEYLNVSVVCSKSGKLTTGLFTKFLENVLKPYVKNNKFLLLIDSWGGADK